MNLSPEEMDALSKLYAMGKEAFHAGGWLALLPFVPMALVNLYKMPFVQAVIEERLPRFAWSHITTMGKTTLSFALGALPVFAANVIGNMGVGAAALLAASAGLAAIFGHTFAFKPLASTEVGSKVGAALHPSISRPLSLVVPFDAARVAEIREANGK